MCIWANYNAGYRNLKKIITVLAPWIVIKLPLLYLAQKRLHVWECSLQTTLLWRRRALRVLVCVLICVSFASCELQLLEREKERALYGNA